MANIERAGLGNGIQGNGIQVTTAGTRGVERTGQAEGGRKTASTGGSREDEVQLSGLASQLAALQPDSAARQERVSALQEVVASGKYSVDPQALARQIVTDAGAE